jgi:DNA-binding transcriptional ArsR family regulator
LTVLDGAGTIREIEYPNEGRSMADLSNPKAAAELLKAFSHATRLAILQELRAGPKCVTDMEEILPARQANISQHLAVLRHANLVDYAQDGALRCYYLCRPQLVEDMLALVGRGDPVVTRTTEEIQADKERLAKLLAGSSSPAAKPAGRRKLVTR